MARRKQTSNNAVVQFRLGPDINDRISNLARKWRVTPNEAARRLVTLATFGLNVNHYDAVERLAVALGGGNEFIRACDQALAALDSSDLSRQQLLEVPLRGQQRAAYLEEWVRTFTSGNQVESPDADDPAPVEPSRPYRAIDLNRGSGSSEQD